MYGEAVIAAMQMARAAGTSLLDPNSILGMGYRRTKKVKPTKSKAVQKRRKANKLAAKQRKSSK